MHLVDLSNPRFAEQIEAVDKILASLELGQRQKLLVFNKIDQLDPMEVKALCRRYSATPVSALDRDSFTALIAEMQQRFWPREGLEAAIPET